MDLLALVMEIQNSFIYFFYFGARGGKLCAVPCAVVDPAVNHVLCPRSVLPWFLIACKENIEIASSDIFVIILFSYNSDLSLPFQI